MNLDFFIKVLGWAMALSPVLVFLVISGYMVWGAAKDDETIMALVMLGLGMFGIGAGILLIVYLTTFSFNTLLS